MPITLDELPPGIPARVVGFRGPGRGAIRRLIEMGVTPGTIVVVVASIGGPVLIRVRGVLVALGRGIARRILVEPLHGLGFGDSNSSDKASNTS